MNDFLMLPTEPFPLVAARMDDPNFVEIGRLPGWGDNNPVYWCFRECTCLFVVDSDTSEIVYPDRFAGRNCRETQDCPCHELTDWHWWDDLEASPLGPIKAPLGER